MNPDLRAVKALEYVQSLYDEHQPDEYGSCGGDHAVDGYEYDLPTWRGYKPDSPHRYDDRRCPFHLAAAGILGLPPVEWVEPPPRPRSEPQIDIPKYVIDEMVASYLTPAPILSNPAWVTGDGPVEFRRA